MEKKKLYVGNLPYEITEDELNQHFSSAGNVASVAIITDRATGRSKGFGFVEMGTVEEAKSAIKMFDGKEFKDRTLKVDFARPRKVR